MTKTQLQGVGQNKLPKWANPACQSHIGEQRFITIGWSNQRRLLMVAHAETIDLIRIISARKLTRTERVAYEEESQK